MVQFGYNFRDWDNFPLNRISAKVDAQIGDFVLTKPVAGYRLDADQLHLKATNEQIYVTGDARINTVPSRVEWSEKIQKKGSDNNDLSTIINISSKVSERDLVALNMNSLSSRMRGHVQADVTLSGKLNNFTRLEVSADLSKAKVSFSPLNHVKPIDSPGTIKLRTDFAQQGRVKDTIIDFNLS
jgi:hypothetical protein